MPPTTMPGEILAVTDHTFQQEVLEAEVPVLLEFWAQWCPPCRMLNPILAEISQERAGSLAVRKINSDENPSVTRNYQVLAVPTLMIFRAGRPLRALTGARPKIKLLAELDDALRGQAV